MRRHSYTAALGTPVQSTFSQLRVFVIVVFLGTAVACADERPGTRTWTSTVGSQVLAAPVEVIGQQVQLEKVDGTVIHVDIHKLSAGDQTFVRHWLDARARMLAAASKSFRPRVAGEPFEGKILQRFNVRGRIKFEVQDNNGRKGWIWEDEWEISDVRTAQGLGGDGNGSASDGPRTGGGENKSGAKNVVEFKPLIGGQLTAPAGSQRPLASEVVAEGIGIDADKALENAFSRAIEQTVGVLVDAETLVSNDELVRETILTFSRGYVEKYEITKTWEQDSLHHVRIQALVAVSKLAEKLQASNIAVRSVAGERMALQAEHDYTNEVQATEMFRKEMAKFRIDQLVAVEVQGEPEVLEQDETHVKLRLKVTMRADQDKWKAFDASIRPLLQRLASKRSAMTRRFGGGWCCLASPDIEGLTSRLVGNGILVSLFSDANSDLSQTQWQVFRVPESFGTVLDDFSKQKFRLVYVLMGQDENVVFRQDQTAEERLPREYKSTFVELRDYPGPTARYIHPFFGAYNGSKLYSVAQSVDVHISKEDLRKVVKFAAFLEEVK
jgi:hypothetical protein